MKRVYDMTKLALVILFIVVFTVSIFFLKEASVDNAAIEEGLPATNLSASGDFSPGIPAEKHPVTSAMLSPGLVLGDEGESEIDYFSYEKLMLHFESRSIEILDAYKVNELNAKTDAEAQYALTLPLRRCDLPSIQNQEDLDLFIAERDQKFDFEASTQILLRRVAECAALTKYLEGTDLSESFLVYFEAARESNHPMALLESRPMQQANAGEISLDEARAIYANAYHYSSDNPEYRLQILGTLLHVLRPQTNKRRDTYKVIGILAAAQALIVESGMEQSDARLVAYEQLSDLMLPLEVSLLLEQADNLETAMEQGNWSFLGEPDGT